MSTQEVKADTRKVKASWTSEAIEDLMRSFGTGVQPVSREERLKDLLRKYRKGENLWPSFDNIAFPLVRKVTGSVIGLDLVSVAPMPLPTGKLYYYSDHIYTPRDPDPYSRLRKLLVRAHGKKA